MHDPGVGETEGLAWGFDLLWAIVIHRTATRLYSEKKYDVAFFTQLGTSLQPTRQGPTPWA